MKSTETSASLLLACGLALGVLPQAFAEAVTPAPDAMFKAMDTNRDARVTRAEHSAGSKQLFAEADVNQDNLLTTAELTTAHESNPDLAVKSGQASVSEVAAEIIEMNDRNNDGHLTATEHAAGGEAMFGRLDHNGDGWLTPAECQEGKNRAKNGE